MMLQQINEHGSARLMRSLPRDCLWKLAPDVHAHRRDKYAEEERHPPAPGIQLFLRQGCGENYPYETAHEDRELLAVTLPRGHGRTLLPRRRFEQVCRGRTDLPAGREALNKASDDEDDRRGHANVCVSRRT